MSRDAGSDALSAVGELAALARILPRLPAASLASVGPGDDAAVVGAPDGRVVVTTDTMIEGPDFRREWTPPFELGWKAAATNLADVAAMGAVPTALVVALAAPGSTPVTELEALADGLREACAALAPGCGVVGGDLAVSPTLTVAVTAFGDLEGRSPVLRSGARAGDAVAVAGRLGRAATGLRLLFAHAVDGEGRADAAAAAALRLAQRDAVDAQLAPRPPIASGPAAAIAGATAMLDVSDGLLLDARRIAVASGVVIDLDPREDPIELVGGEDHALLACFPPGAALPEGFTVIGRVVSAAGAAGAGVAGAGVTVGGVLVDERGGWDPYTDSAPAPSPSPSPPASSAPAQ